MRYHIDLRHKYRDIVKNLGTNVSINRLEYQKHEDVLYLINKDIIHLGSDSYIHSRLNEYIVMVLLNVKSLKKKGIKKKMALALTLLEIFF